MAGYNPRVCGRYTLRTPLQHVIEMFSPLAASPELDLFPRFNVAPTQDVPAVRLDRDGRRELVALHWGLVPHWAKDPSIGNRMINARAETAAQKPAFRDAFRRRRCLVVADGFYEWRRLPNRKQPYFIHMRNDEPFAFAGLWERWGEGDQVVRSCTLLTTGPNELMAPIHDRMPVIVAREEYDRWLDPRTPPGEIEKLLRPFPADAMEARPVSPVVNNPKTDQPECIDGITEEAE
jgi:putative SOS response-associated peptidase YedK